MIHTLLFVPHCGAVISLNIETQIMEDQMRKIMTALVVAQTLTGIAAVLPTTASASEVQSHTFDLRVECRKTNSRGCTASGQATTHAPRGMFFIGGQNVPGKVISSWSPGHQPVCYSAKPTGGVPVRHGLVAQTSMSGGLHAESGSGMSNIGKVAYVVCRYTAQIAPIPR